MGIGGPGLRARNSHGINGWDVYGNIFALDTENKLNKNVLGLLLE